MSRGIRQADVRDAGVDDAREIQRVAQITWDHTYRETIPESVRREFVSQAYSADLLRHRMESNVFLVAAMGEEILGFVDFRRLTETSVQLAAIYVLPGMQGRGIGSRLLESGMGRFPPLTNFMLRVERDNTRALNFYESHGFRRTGEYAEEFYGYVVHETEMILHAPDSTPRSCSSESRIRRK